MAEGPKSKEIIEDGLEGLRWIGGMSLALFALFGAGMPSFFHGLFQVGMLAGVGSILTKFGMDLYDGGKK